jgi:hypothetical protein
MSVRRQLNRRSAGPTFCRRGFFRERAGGGKLAIQRRNSNVRIFLCACLVLAGCGSNEGTIKPGQKTAKPVQGDQAKPAADELTPAELKEVSDTAERGRKEVERLIAEGKAAGIEREVQAAVGRLNLANNERMFREGQLNTARWYEQQVTGKTPAQFIAAFPEK